MDRLHLYLAHLIGLFLISGALVSGLDVHPALWVGSLSLVVLPALFELDTLSHER